ncbi:MAG: nickel pincer cofactor biosynthesis protein LarB, partial [Desulfuromonadales bacterium]
MNQEYLKTMLNSVQQGALSVDAAMLQLRQLPFQDIGCAQVDHHRQLRQGMPEMVFGEGKTVEQILAITAAMSDKGSNILVTRLDKEKAELIAQAIPEASYHVEARCLTLEHQPPEQRGKGIVLVVSAGTSDIPVAAEALVTARFLGNQVGQIYDVGVAGIHRLLARHDQLSAASVIIVVAGMEGALPTVVSGLCD